MVARKTLRAVADGETAPRKPPKTVTEAAESGTTLDLLVAMRSRIAKAVEDALTPARDLAALTKRLSDVQKEIDAILAREQEDARSEDVGDGEFDASAV